MRTCLLVAVDRGDDGRDAVDADLAADALWSLGAVAVQETAESLVAGFADDDAAASARAALIDRWPARVVKVVDVDEGAWREALRSPPTTVPVGAGVVVALDPGTAFGNGAHPTTRMALDVLVDRVRAGDRVLDVGCGSGVLSVAAARLGAARVVAIDVDPSAVDVTVDNAARNGVHDVVEASTTSVADVPGTFDLVVANLGGRVVVDVLAPVLAGRTARPAGVLVVGGLLDDGSPPPIIPGFGVVDVVRRSGWTTVVYR